MVCGALFFVAMPLLTVVAPYTSTEAAFGVGFLVNTLVFLDWRHRLRLWLQVLASEALGLFPIGLVLLRGVPAVPSAAYWFTLFAGSLLAFATSWQIDLWNHLSNRRNHQGWRHSNGCKWPNFKVVVSMPERPQPVANLSGSQDGRDRFVTTLKRTLKARRI
jgi:hypothetical protein